MALAEADRKRVRWLAAMLRITIALDRTRQAIVESVSVHVADGGLRPGGHVANGADASVESFTANNRSALLAKVAKRSVEIEIEE